MKLDETSARLLSAVVSSCSSRVSVVGVEAEGIGGKRGLMALCHGNLPKQNKKKSNLGHELKSQILSDFCVCLIQTQS